MVSLLAWYPKTSFLAFSTRGDGILDGRQGNWVSPTRKVLFAAADRIEWLYRASSKNPYDDLIENAEKDAAYLPSPLKKWCSPGNYLCILHPKR
jgi:hypothetical protein